MSHDLSVVFGSRATDGTDIASIIRDNLPGAELTAELDAAGAVTGYRLDLHFEDPERAVAASLDLAAYLTREGFEFEVGDVDV